MPEENRDKKTELIKKYRKEYNSRFGPFGEERLSQDVDYIKLINNNEPGILNNDGKCEL